MPVQTIPVPRPRPCWTTSMSPLVSSLDPSPPSVPGPIRSNADPPVEPLVSPGEASFCSIDPTGSKDGFVRSPG
eukprot:scaffold426_cov319-Pavlova_lutheri.AAC.32